MAHQLGATVNSVIVEYESYEGQHKGSKGGANVAWPIGTPDSRKRLEKIAGCVAEWKHLGKAGVPTQDDVLDGWF